MDFYQFKYVEQSLRDIYDVNVEQLMQSLKSRGFDYFLRKISATLLSACKRILSELVEKEGCKNVLNPSAQLGIIYGPHLCATIYKILEVFPDFLGPHGWLHCLIFISVVFQKDCGYLSPHYIVSL